MIPWGWNDLTSASVSRQDLSEQHTDGLNKNGASLCAQTYRDLNKSCAGSCQDWIGSDVDHVGACLSGIESI